MKKYEYVNISINRFMGAKIDEHGKIKKMDLILHR